MIVPDRRGLAIDACWLIWIVRFAAAVSLLQSASTDRTPRFHCWCCWCPCCCCWSIRCCCCCYRFKIMTNRQSDRRCWSVLCQKIGAVPPLLRTKTAMPLQHCDDSIGCLLFCLPIVSSFCGIDHSQACGTDRLDAFVGLIDLWKIIFHSVPRTDSTEAL